VEIQNVPTVDKNDKIELNIDSKEKKKRSIYFVAYKSKP